MRRILFLYCCLTLSFLSSAQVVKKLLIARNTGTKVLSSGDSIRVFGFAESLGKQPSIPGPTLYFNEGDSVNIELFNVSQGAPHTIHLHGLDVDQANDGVPHLSFEVGHMKRGNYQFVAPHAGTYLYHCHVVSTIHVQAGMYGLLVVRAKDGEKKAWTNGPVYDEEFTFLTSEIDTNWHTDSVLLHDHNDTMALQIPVPKYKPQYFLVNGFSDEQLKTEEVEVKLSGGGTGLIRLANIGFTVLIVEFPNRTELKPVEILASDGRPLPVVEKSNRITVFPGERYDLLIKPLDGFDDSISFKYIDINNGEVLNEQNVLLRVGPAGSVKDLSKDDFNILVFPNPNNGEINIITDPLLGRVKQIECQDLTGRKLSLTEYKKDTNQYKIKVENFTGIVLIQVVFEDGGYSFHKVVIQ